MTDEHNGPCGKYCAVVDECQARDARIAELEAALWPFLNGGVPLADMTREEYEYVKKARDAYRGEKE